MIGYCRAVALILGLIILAWQAGNAARGAFWHPFLVPDLLVATGLLVAATRKDGARARLLLLHAFAATAGVFLVATIDACLRLGFSVGRMMTAAGLVPCASCLIALKRAREERSEE